MNLVDIFITFIYQPFFNILVGFYWLLDVVTGGNPDMGIAVILLTLVVRFLMLPISLSGHRSEKEKRDIAAEIKEIERLYASEPIIKEAKKEKSFKKIQSSIGGRVN
jgi:YidC/Oxa1 family membrane protein insertase